MTNTTALKSVSVENLNLKIVNLHTEKQIWNMITWSKKVLLRLKIICCRKKNHKIAYSKWNDPQNFRRITTELTESAVPENAIFAVKTNEHIERTYTRYYMTCLDELREHLDHIDAVIIEMTAVCKYLNSLQIHEYITLRGFDITRSSLRNRIQKLIKYRVIQEHELIAEYKRGLKYYELDHFGNILALKSGIPFHKGNCYTPYFKRKEEGIPDDTPCDVKRVLVGNQIILHLLINNCQMKRFGIMETFRANDLEHTGKSCMFRTAANIHINNKTILAYEVVRNTPDSYEKLLNKLKRYYDLIHNTSYLASNYHGDHAYPQMVICGESLKHNIKIAEFLRNNGMWKKENPLFFTEDLLNMNHSLVSLYALTEDNSQIWYALPENINLSQEAAS